MKASILAGCMAAVAAAAVSLPLHSPSDSLFNTASVVTGVLALSVVSGLWWRWTSARATPWRWFAGGHLVGLIAWVMVAAVLESQLDRVVSFTVPLAAIAFGALATLTPRLSKSGLAARRLPVAAALMIAIAVGAGLAGQGDAKSGRLELPPRAGLERIAPT